MAKNGRNGLVGIQNVFCWYFPLSRHTSIHCDSQDLIDNMTYKIILKIRKIYQKTTFSMLCEEEGGNEAKKLKTKKAHINSIYQTLTS